MANNIIWQPQPQQKKFMERPEFECLYGGAAGGGKSDALVAEALRQIHIPHYKGLILRRTYPQLSELIDKSLLLYKRAVPGAAYNTTTHTWTFPTGAKIVFGSMNRKQDRINYQGKAYDFVGFDELTHFDNDEYTYLYSRARPNGPGTRVYIRATTNPGGRGHGWVKERFITAAPPLTPISQAVTIKTPDGGSIEVMRKRIFVPATVFDNQKLLDNDPGYIATLGMMPEAEKRALLYGDWDSFSGQVFTEFRNDPEHYADRLHTHVIDPFEIPGHWPIYRSFDWGYAKPFSCGWYAVDNERRIYRIRELYGCTGTPDTGVKWEVGQVAEAIREIEDSDIFLKGKHIHGIADPAIWQVDGKAKGKSIADIFAGYRIWLDKGDHTRIPGKMQCHYRLRFDDRGVPMFYVFNTCKHFIRTIPNLIYSETDPEDVDTTCEDHIYDEWRYMNMQHEIAAEELMPTRNIDHRNIDDPLNMVREQQNARLRRYEYV